MLTHNDLITLGVQLGYKDLEAGLCNGFNCMWLQAYFCDQLPAFYKRLRIIHQHKDHIHLLVERIRMAQENNQRTTVDLEFLDILAFYEGMTLYLKPEDYQFLFPNFPTLNQEDIDVIFELIKPVLLNNQQLNFYYDHEYVLTEKEFISLFSRFANIFAHSLEPIALLVSCSDHTVSLAYNDKTSQWLYMDVNSLNNCESLNYHWEVDTLKLFNTLQTSFRSMIYLSFNVKILSTHHTYPIKEQFQSLSNCTPISEIGRTDSKGVGLLYLACQNGNINHVRQLLQQGYTWELNRKNKDGLNPFLITCLYGYADILSLLQNSSVEYQVNAANNEGATALHLACASGHARIVEELLNHPKLQVNQTNHSGVTPLYIACQTGHDEIVALLLQHKQLQPLDTIGLEGHTPLMVACLSPRTQNNKKLFTLLLAHGASMTLKNNAGQTALDIAVSTNNSAAIDVLSLWLLHHPQQLSQFMSPLTFTTIDKKYLHKSRINKEPLTFFNKQNMAIEAEPINRCSLKV